MMNIFMENRLRAFENGNLCRSRAGIDYKYQVFIHYSKVIINNCNINVMN
jgi:hypothetical protein